MEVYFDNSATTRCYDSVKDIVIRTMTEDFGNPSAMHLKGVEAEKYVKDSEARLARILKVQEKEILFTSGGTESDNLALIGAAMANKRSGNHIITTAVEHPAVSQPALFLQEQGFEVTYLPVDSRGVVKLDALEAVLRPDTILVSVMYVNNEVGAVMPVEEIKLDALEAVLRPDTILVSVMYVNNEVGAVMPVEEIGRRIREKSPKALFHVDAIQAFGKYRIYPKKMGIDLLSVSSHKIHGPKGVGFLYINEKAKIHVDAIQAFGKYRIYPKKMGIDLLSVSSHKIHGPKGVGFLYINEKAKIQPQILGGGQQSGMRSGTDNVPGIAGLGVAAEEIYRNLDANVEKMYCLKEHIAKELTKIPDIRINGMELREGAPQILSISVMGVRSEVLLHSLEERGIFISAGSACSSHKRKPSSTLAAMGMPKDQIESTVRLSFSEENTVEEADYFLQVMEEMVPMLRRYSRR